jgi:microcystin-dependent protein
MVGEIKLYSGEASSLPCNWVFSHGQALSRIEYRRLFSVIGESFGAGDGKTTFNVPDFRDRFPLGVNSIGSGIDSWKKGGNKEQRLTIDQMPTHYHGVGTLHTANAGTHTHHVHDPGHNHEGYTGHDDRPTLHQGNGRAANAIEHYTNYLDHHRHSIPIGHTGISLNHDGTHSHSIGGSTNSVDDGNSFGIMPPYQTIAYIIFTAANCA